MLKELSFGGVSCKVFQLGFVVEDIHAAMKFWVETMKVGPFMYIPEFLAEEGVYRGQKSVHKQAMAHAYGGRFFVELIQLLDDKPSVFKEYVDRNGYGLQHYGLCVMEEDFDGFHNHLLGLGFEDVFCDIIPPGQRIRYMAPVASEERQKLRELSGVGFIELSECKPGNEGFFGAIRQAAENWDGKSETFEL